MYIQGQSYSLEDSSPLGWAVARGNCVLFDSLWRTEDEDTVCARVTSTYTNDCREYQDSNILGTDADGDTPTDVDDPSNNAT